MISCLIIDDEEAGRMLVKEQLNRHFPSITKIKMAASIHDALQLIKKENIDLVFLDIHLKGVNGFTFLSGVPERTFEVIFVTAYDEYALKAIQENALYYLLKPIDRKEFIKGVEKALEVIHKKKEMDDHLIYLSGEHKMEAVAYSEILCIQSSGAYSTFHLEHKSVVTSKNIGYYESVLPPSLFIRTHHSFIVNIQKIQGIVKKRSGEIILSNNQSIPISQRKLPAVLSRLKVS